MSSRWHEFAVGAGHRRGPYPRARWFDSIDCDEADVVQAGRTAVRTANAGTSPAVWFKFSIVARRMASAITRAGPARAGRSRCSVTRAARAALSPLAAARAYPRHLHRACRARPRHQTECGRVRILGGVLRPVAFAQLGRRVATEPLGDAQPSGTALFLGVAQQQSACLGRTTMQVQFLSPRPSNLPPVAQQQSPRSISELLGVQVPPGGLWSKPK
jgi:hypothetical protein